MKKIILCLLLLKGVVYAGKPSNFKLPLVVSKDSVEIVRLPKDFDHLSVRDFTISPKNDEILFTAESNKNTIATIMHMIKKNGKWYLDVAPFSGNFYDLEATFTPDGNSLFFASNRPLDSDSTIKDFDIWKTDKINGVWQTPKNLGNVINTEADEFYPAITNSGTLYFTAQYKHSKGKEDIWMSKYVNGNYTTPESISDSVNTALYEFNAFVSPNDSIIIFTSCGRSDDLGGCDLYISKKEANGIWSKAKNLGSKINSDKLDYCPYISFDNKFFVFTSNRTKLQKSYKQKLNIDTFLKEMQQVQNGKGNLYWINADEVLK